MPPNHMKHNVRADSNARTQPVTAGPQWTRLPLPGHRCTYTDLTRTALENLCCPRATNNYRPPVRAYCNRARGAVRGVWYVHLPSLLEYLDTQADRQAKEYIGRTNQKGEPQGASGLVRATTGISAVA